MNTLRNILTTLEKGINDNTMTHDELKSTVLSLDNELYDLENTLTIAAEIAAILGDRAGADDRELTKDTIDNLIIGHERTKALFSVLTDYLYQAKASLNA